MVALNVICLSVPVYRNHKWLTNSTGCVSVSVSVSVSVQNQRSRCEPWPRWRWGTRTRLSLDPWRKNWSTGRRRRRGTSRCWFPLYLLLQTLPYLIWKHRDLQNSEHMTLSFLWIQNVQTFSNMGHKCQVGPTTGDTKVFLFFFIIVITKTILLFYFFTC